MKIINISKINNMRRAIKTCKHNIIVTDYPVVDVHVDELSSARIGQQQLCATLSANININTRIPIKVYYRFCTVKHIRIEINHGSQNVF